MSRISLRIRLTAWYTLLLALVLLALGVSLSILFERQLKQEMDDRLLSTVESVRDRSVLVSGDLFDRLVLPVDPFTSPSVLVQVVSVDGRQVRTSANLGSNVLPMPRMASDRASPIFSDTRMEGTTVRLVTLSLKDRDGRLLGVAMAGESVLDLNRALAYLRQLLLTIAVPALLFAAIGGWLLAERALRPVDTITATAANIAASHDAATSLTARLRVPRGGDEIARLAETFNAMLDRLEAAFAAQRRFVADASHELRTPLTAIRGNVDVLTRQLCGAVSGLPEGFDGALTDIGRESQRMGRLLDDLLLLARADASGEPMLRRRDIDLVDVATEAVQTARGLATGPTLQLIAASPVPMRGDPDRLHQLLVILLDNALRHTPVDGRVTVTVVADADRITVAVSDTGEGIEAHDLPRIFDRFYRADTTRNRSTGGAGLGLSIATTVAHLHGGDVTVTSEPGVGSNLHPGPTGIPPEHRFRAPRPVA